MRHLIPLLAAIVVAAIFYWLLSAIDQTQYAYGAMEGIALALVLWYALYHKWK